MIIVSAPTCSRAFFGSTSSTCSKSLVTRIATRIPSNKLFCMQQLPILVGVVVLFYWPHLLPGLNLGCYSLLHSITGLQSNASMYHSTARKAIETIASTRIDG